MHPNRPHSAWLSAASVALLFAIGLYTSSPERTADRIRSMTVYDPTSSQAGPAVPAADAGEALYMQHCLACHAADGHGSDRYPDIAGDKFKHKYGSMDKAYAFISTNMPASDPGSLREEEYKAIVRYVLGLNGIPTQFSDLDNHWAAEPIAELLELGYVDGYTEQGRLLYKPDRNITREDFVTFLVKAKELFLSNSASSTTSGLTDIAGSKRKTYIYTALDYGLVDGYPDGTFRPEQPISRAEIAAVLSRSEALAAAEPAAGGSGDAARFPDVAPTHWARVWIEAAASAGLFQGYEDGTFRPGESITRAEAAAVLQRIVHGGT